MDVPYDIDENDVSMDSGLFENRYRFLLFCQKNNYQFDTLRRAKHSSMMILHYLHNPTSLLAETTCCICDKDTPLHRCWQCETCSDFFVCAACYNRGGCSLHVHKLSLHPSAVNSSAENRAAQKKGLLVGSWFHINTNKFWFPMSIIWSFILSKSCMHVNRNCWKFCCMPLDVITAPTPIAVLWKSYSSIQKCALLELLEVVNTVRRYGSYWDITPEVAKNPTATCHGAGIFRLATFQKPILT